MAGLKVPATAPTWALLFGAATWGIVWYPYRLLAQAGVEGIWSTLFTYAIALVVGVLAFPRVAVSLARAPKLAILMGLAIGWSNLAYVLGMLEGEVMRVLLLFYLAPLWTVPLSRLILDERLDGRGAIVMAIAFVGAMIMLWHPAIGLPWPANRAEWLGVGAGFCFALGNVLVRRLQEMGDAAKSIVIWAGVAAVALAYVPFSDSTGAAALAHARGAPLLVVGIGLALFAMSLALQYGLSRLPANRAIVILLFELVVAAIAAYVLAGEVMRPQDWIGGALIVAATVFPARYSSRGTSP
jgi:drug/metabolite transporter (DMT)-like permease